MIEIFKPQLYPLRKEFKKSNLPWSEQKKPCRHLAHDSFPNVFVMEDTGAGLGFFTAVDGLDKTGLSVVCFPVLHLHSKRSTINGF